MYTHLSWAVYIHTLKLTGDIISLKYNNVLLFFFFGRTVSGLRKQHILLEKMYRQWIQSLLGFWRDDCLYVAQEHTC